VFLEIFGQPWFWNDSARNKGLLSFSALQYVFFSSAAISNGGAIYYDFLLPMIQTMGLHSFSGFEPRWMIPGTGCHESLGVPYVHVVIHVVFRHFVLPQISPVIVM
jgi:hypothetical protein